MKKILAALAAALAVAGLTAFGMSDAHAGTLQHLRIMPLGDSITWGVGSSTTSSYRADLWNMVTGAGYSLDFVGGASSGALPDPDNEGHPGLWIDEVAAFAPAVSRPPGPTS